ncbi:MAG: methylenetetrahydrofolate reductase [NAD(P)H] [Candidatus Omnitrophota bacterium]|nr:methylenetetrahydrofolate reductase [NAD(P)H] [Candidatus Omnitrophota bacterium]
MTNQRASMISFELFPPKTPEGYEKLLATIAQLCALKPDFISCTYGAGGGSRDKTLDIVEHIQKTHGVAAVAHLTCVLHTRDEIKAILQDMKRRGISRVLALRGDPPKENPDWKAGPDNFRYSSDLVAFIRKHFGNHFTIGVAGFPEGHILALNREMDAQHLKTKIDAGADYVITQLFFNNQDYFDYIARLKKLGVNKPVIPGILPITDYQALVRFCLLCGASIPAQVHKIFKPLADDPQKTLEAGIEFTVAQCRELLKGGAPGLHFYTLNKLSPTDIILKEISR